jgi:hypothetical protein
VLPGAVVIAQMARHARERNAQRHLPNPMIGMMHHCLIAGGTRLPTRNTADGPRRTRGERAVMGGVDIGDEQTDTQDHAASTFR